jgi:transporter family-2 protein
MKRRAAGSSRAGGAAQMPFWRRAARLRAAAERSADLSPTDTATIADRSNTLRRNQMSTGMASYVVIAILTGALGAIHVPINGALGARIQSTAVATFTFYGVAFLIIACVTLLTTERESIRQLARVPVWLYLVPGIISVVVVASGTFLMPRLGAVNVFVITVFAQTLVRVAISHYGWLASPVDPISASKLAGAIMVAVGAVLVVRS